jgi:hypothetical protein
MEGIGVLVTFIGLAGIAGFAFEAGRDAYRAMKDVARGFADGYRRALR